MVWARRLKIAQEFHNGTIEPFPNTTVFIVFQGSPPTSHCSACSIYQFCSYNKHLPACARLVVIASPKFFYVPIVVVLYFLRSLESLILAQEILEVVRILDLNSNQFSSEPFFIHQCHRETSTILHQNCGISFSTILKTWFFVFLNSCSSPVGRMRTLFVHFTFNFYFPLEVLYSLTGFESLGSNTGRIYVAVFRCCWI